MKACQSRASVSPVVVEMHREYSDGFGLCRDHFQAVSSQEVEHANLPVHAAGQHAKEDERQRSNLPAGKSAGVSSRDDAHGGQPENVRLNLHSNGL